MSLRPSSRSSVTSKSLDLLGRHVEKRAPDGRRQARPVFEVHREVEIEQHRLPFVGEQDVAGLEVQMQDPALVGMGQPARQPGDDPQDGLDIR